ncbi:MAG: hypothetical protein HKN72_00535 [Gemmatimonadetes bacterium]|nr:hypothetical protein [Gemmatimonadota bacterium]NNL30527.1 hypothetical protein [Gemmatimonadota bacterium]
MTPRARLGCAALVATIAATVFAATTPASAAGQLGVAARAGTLGIGGEVALAFTDRIVVRGGAGRTSYLVTTTFDGVRMEVDLPESWYNAGLDLYLNGVFRIGGGVLFKPDDASMVGRLEGSVDIGGQTFTPQEVGTLTGTIVSKDRAPYVLVGLGKHTAAGFGLSLDIGAAFTGEPRVTLEAEGGTYPDQAELDSRLDQEAMDFEGDMKTYLKIWPIVSLGLRLGIG